MRIVYQIGALVIPRLALTSQVGGTYKNHGWAFLRAAGPGQLQIISCRPKCGYKLRISYA
jgi:hypothetical protein